MAEGANLGSVYYEVDADVSAMLKAEAQINKSIDEVVSDFSRADAEVKEFIATQNKLGRVLNTSGQVIDKNGDAVADASIQYRKLAAEAERLKQASLGQSKLSKSVNTAMAGIGRSAGQAGIQLQQFIGQVQGGQSAMLALSQQSADLGFVLGAPLVGAIVGISASLAGILLPELMGTKDALADIEKMVERVQAAMTLSAEGVADYSDEMRKLRDISEALFKVKIASLIAEQSRAMEVAVEGLGDALSDVQGWLTSYSIPAKIFGKRSDETVASFEELKNAADELSKGVNPDSINQLEMALRNAEKAGINNTEVGTELVNKMTSLIVKYKQGEEVVAKFTKTLEGSNEGLDESSNKVRNSLESMANQVAIAKVELEQGARAAVIYAAGQRAIADEAPELVEQYKEMAAKLFDYNQQIKDNADAERERESAINATNKALDAMFEKEERDAAAKAKRAAAAKESETKKAVSFAGGIVDSGMSESERLAQQQVQLEEYYQKKLLTTQQYEEAITAIQMRQQEIRAENEKARNEVILSSSQQFFDSAAGLAEVFAGEQSKAYKTLFAISKGFAIAQATMNLSRSISEASALPWPANIPAMASAAANGASIVSNIQSLSYDGGRLYGGSTAPNSMYKVTEDGRPEMFTDGRDSFLMTGSRGGAVTSNGDMGSGSPSVNIVVNNNASGAVAAASYDEDARLVTVTINELSRQVSENEGQFFRSLTNGTTVRGKAT